jgi:trigger factor
MPVTVESAGPCRKRLRVEVDAGRVAGVRAEIVREFCKQAAIPGFRPGHAPVPMVEKRYGPAIDEEVRKRLVPDTYREALREHHLRVVGPPRIREVEHQPGQPLRYAAEIDTAPEFELPEYKGIALSKKTEPVTDEDVNGTLEQLRDQQAEFVAVEGRGLQTGDFAVLDYSGVADGKPIADLAPDARGLGEGTDFWMLIETDSFLPGFCDQLRGLVPGEKRQAQVDFPADFPQPALAGRKATYFVELKAIKQKKLPPLDDAFAQKLGMESLEKFRAEIRQALETERQQQARADLRRQVVDYLLGRVQCDLPESLVAQETRNIVYDVVRQNTLRGATKEQLEQRKDEIFGFAIEGARNRLRASFILEAIAAAEKIDVEPGEIEQRIRQLAAQNRTTPQRVRAQLEEHDGLEDIAQQILISKTIDFLVANATLQTVSPA